MTIPLPAHISFSLDRLTDNGYEAFLVGGCVRDHLMGKVPLDYDIATSAKPETVKSLFDEFKTIDTGIKHGTVRVILEDVRCAENDRGASGGRVVEGSCDVENWRRIDGDHNSEDERGARTGIVSGGQCSVEITTYRRDGTYTDNRHPKQVEFVNSIHEDLMRRDLTINAIAYHPQRGFIDPFDGAGDIAAAVLRSVGKADERIAEDALRIMRTLRFSATLGFSIDAKLDQSLKDHCHLLTNIAPERITTELMQMLMGKNVAEVLLTYAQVIATFIPELALSIGFDQKTPYHCYDVWEHTVRAIDMAAQDPLVRLSLLMHDLGKPQSFFMDESGRGHFYGHNLAGEEIARARLKALRFSNDTIEKVSTTIRYHQLAIKPDNVRKWLSRLGIEQLRLLIAVKKGDMAAHAPEYVKLGLERIGESEEVLEALVAAGSCFTLKDLAINGDDLLAIGIPKGEAIGEILSFLLDSVVNDRLINSREELLKAAEDWSEE